MQVFLVFVVSMFVVAGQASAQSKDNVALEREIRELQVKRDELARERVVLQKKICHTSIQSLRSAEELYRISVNSLEKTRQAVSKGIFSESELRWQEEQVRWAQDHLADSYEHAKSQCN